MATVGEVTAGAAEVAARGGAGDGDGRSAPDGPARGAARGADGGGGAGASARRRTPRRLPLRGRLQSTPARLRALVGGVLVLTAATGLLCWQAGTQAQSTWSTITGSQAPQVVDASALYQSLTDQDAQTANVLVDGADPALAANRTTALNQYTSDRTAADRALQQATLSAAGNGAVQSALAAVLDGMGDYDGLAARALALNDQARAAAGHPDPTALAEYRQATDLMQNTLLPAANRLLQADNTAYNDSYDAQRSDLTAAEVWTAVLGTLLLLSLLGLQGWLLRRYRRIVNPPLAAATLLALLVVGTALTLFPAERTQLHTARRDAFDSVVALDRARAISYDANADESRYMLDQGRRAQYQQSFFDDSQQLADLPLATSVSSYDTPLQVAIDDYHRNHQDVEFGGFFGTEFRNITFPGERAGAEATLDAYQKYQLDDRHLRSLMTDGQLDQAIAYNTSLAAGGSNADFGVYDQALTKLIGINDAAYVTAAHSGAGELSDRVPLMAGGSLAVVLLCLLGVRPRLAEYRR